MSKTANCKIDGCRTAAFAREMCSKHYQRWRKGQSMDGEVETCFCGKTFKPIKLDGQKFCSKRCGQEYRYGLKYRYSEDPSPEEISIRMEWRVPRDKPEYLYHLLNKDGELVYIGISKKPFYRFRWHLRMREDVDKMVVVQAFESRFICELAEYVAITTHRPKQNRMYMNGERLHYKVLSFNRH